MIVEKSTNPTDFHSIDHQNWVDAKDIKASFAIGHDGSNIHLLFRVEEPQVRAVNTKFNSPVWEDSCVEFFFSPGDSTKTGYFNLEMNCGGTMLFHHQIKPRTSSTRISGDHIQQIEVATTLPDIVDPEIEEETTWIVEYSIPYSVLSNYHTFSKSMTI